MPCRNICFCICRFCGHYTNNGICGWNCGIDAFWNNAFQQKHVFHTYRTKNETHLFPVSVLSGTLLALVVLGGLLTLIWMGNIGQLSWMKNNVDSAHAYSGTENSANVLGVSFMTTYLLPLETISVYLLAVLVGAAYLARRKSRM